MKTFTRIVLLLVLLGVFQIIVQQITAQTGGLTKDLRRFL